MIKTLETIGKQSGIKRILLDVRCKNKAARALYEREGFTEDGIRKSFYSNPEEDAVLMSKVVSEE